MAWSTITDAEFILEGLNSTERTAIESQAGGDVGLAGIITAAIAEWRGAIEAGEGELDADETTLPPFVRRHVIAQMRWQLLLKFPNLPQLQTDARKLSAERAEEVLEMIAKGDLEVEAPEDADVVPVGGCAGGQVRVAMRTDDQDTDYSAD